VTTTDNEILTALDVNCETGEQTIRELNSNEIAQRKLDQAEGEAQQAEANAKVAARESALAKLKALGLTQAEISAL
jgi:hypothetical protein